MALSGRPLFLHTFLAFSIHFHFFLYFANGFDKTQRYSATRRCRRLGVQRKWCTKTLADLLGKANKRQQPMSTWTEIRDSAIERLSTDADARFESAWSMGEQPTLATRQQLAAMDKLLTNFRRVTDSIEELRAQRGIATNKGVGEYLERKGFSSTCERGCSRMKRALRTLESLLTRSEVIMAKLTARCYRKIHVDAEWEDAFFSRRRALILVLCSVQRTIDTDVACVRMLRKLGECDCEDAEDSARSDGDGAHQQESSGAASDLAIDGSGPDVCFGGPPSKKAKRR